MKTNRKTTANRRTCAGQVVSALALALLTALVPDVRAGQQWWDVGTNTNLTGGNGTWSTSDSNWANSAAPGTNAPGVWVNGNDAVFNNTDVSSSILVGNVFVGTLAITGNKAYTFSDMGSVLTISNGVFNTDNSAIFFGTAVALGGNQTWFQNVNTLTVTGAISGADCILRKTGNGTLVFSNANNSVGGLLVDSGTLQAFNGGNVLGGSSAEVALGQSNQSSLAVLALNTTLAGATTYAIGDLTSAGFAQLSLNTAVANSTNILNAGALARTPGVGATLAITPQNGLGTRAQVTFSPAPMPVNGMLAPWLVNATTANFVTHGAGGLTDVVYDATQAGGWDGTKKVNIGGVASVSANTNVYAMKVGANVTVNSGSVLNNASGGFIITGGNVLGGGTVSVGANELLAYVTGTRSLTPTLDGSGGLTLFGGGTLTLSNLTYTGNTRINQGALTVAPASDQTYAGAIDGLGTLNINGPGMLTLTGTNTALAALSFANSAVTLDGSLTTTNFAPTKGFALVLNGRLVTTNAVNFWSTSSNTGLVSSANASGLGGTWDLQKQAVTIGSAGSVSNNLLNLNNVTVTNVGSVAIGSQNLGNGNGLIVSNGAAFYSGSVNVGTGNGNNTWSYNNFYQVGGAGAPVTVVNGAIALGSCYFDAQPYKGSLSNSLVVTNASLSISGLAVGSRQSTSNNASVFANAIVNLRGGGITVGTHDTSGKGVAYGNSVSVVGGIVTNAGAVTVGSGNINSPATVYAASNSLSVSDGGQFYGGNLKVGERSGDSNNRVLLTSNGLLEVGNVTLGPGPGAVLTNSCGVLQFANSAPTITRSSDALNIINSGTISFRAITNANVLCNRTGNALATNKLTWAGNNAFRLNWATNTVAVNQTYVFDPGLGSTNFFRLEMVSGFTQYRGKAGDSLTIGTARNSGGEMLCSNTTASVTLPFVLNGDLTLFNSSLTFTQSAAINGDVHIDLDNLPESGAAIVAKGALTIGSSSTLYLSGTALDGMQLLACDGGTRTGTFMIGHLPRDYSVRYEPSGAVSLYYMPAGTTILVR